MKIYGTTVGTNLPKPSWAQANPKKGDFIKDKPTEMEPVRGYSAYQVAVMNGFEGTEAEWLESLKADTEVVVQEIIKPENITVIVEQAMENIPGHMEVTVDGGSKASHSASEINAHVENGGSVVLNTEGYSNGGGYAQLWFRSPLVVIFAHTDMTGESKSQTLFSIGEDKTYGEETFTYTPPESTLTPEQIQEAVDNYLEEHPVSADGKIIDHFVITEGSDGAVTMETIFTDGGSDTFAVPADEKPAYVVFNGQQVPIEWAVSE